MPYYIPKTNAPFDTYPGLFPRMLYVKYEEERGLEKFIVLASGANLYIVLIKLIILPFTYLNSTLKI
jgi:hypothetical protein